MVRLCIDLARAVGDHRELAWWIAEDYTGVDRHDLVKQRTLLLEALGHARGVDDAASIAPCSRHLGSLELHDGRTAIDLATCDLALAERRTDEAVAPAVRALRPAYVGGNIPFASASLRRMARIEVRRDRLVAAARLFGVAGTFLSLELDLYLALEERDRTACRDALGDEAFGSAFDQGRNANVLELAAEIIEREGAIGRSEPARHAELGGNRAIA